MINNRLKLAIPLSALLLLSSCRTEEFLQEIEQKEEISKKFITFTKKHENDVIDYGEGFKYLALRYDSIHKTNITGNANIEAFKKKLQSNKKEIPLSEREKISYIDFNIRSQLIEENNGDKWMIFPEVKGKKVVNLVAAVLSKEETLLGYHYINKETNFYKENIGLFQERYNKRFLGGKDPLLATVRRWYKDGDYVSIDEVIISIKQGNSERINGDWNMMYLPTHSGGGGGGFDCNFYGACLSDIMGSGGNGFFYPDPPPNPCDKAKIGKNNADNIINNDVVKEKMDKVLRNKLGSDNEWTVSIGQNADGSYSVSKELEGQPTSGNVPDVPSGNYVGDGHIHSGSGVPSPGDFYGMLKIMKDNIHYQVRFVYGRLYGNEEVYALIITDRNLAMQFLANYPMEQHYDYDEHTFRDDSPIYKDYSRIEKIGYNGYYNMTDVYGDRAIAMSYVLDKYNTGIALVKQNKNGKFESFKVTETPYIDKLAAGEKKNGATITNPCP